MIRVWTEEEPGDWRARITWFVNGGPGSQTVSYASSAAEIHAAVSDWLTAFVRSGAPGEQ